jgi:transcriptional regulator with XRE-family HTH domain
MKAAALLKMARKRAGLTQRELAQRTGLPQTSIARIETGRTDPRLGTLARLLAGCGETATIGAAGTPGGLAALGLSDRAERYLAEMTRRIVEGFGPERVVLFGSQVRGRARPDSDVDLLVIFDRLDDRRATRIAIRQVLSDLPIDKDLVVCSRDETIRRGAVIGSIVGQALREGVVLYGR